MSGLTPSQLILLGQVEEMGVQRKKAIETLERCDWDIIRVLSCVFDVASEEEDESELPVDRLMLLEELATFGVGNKAQCREALEASGWDISMATANIFQALEHENNKAKDVFFDDQGLFDGYSELHEGLGLGVGGDDDDLPPLPPPPRAHRTSYTSTSFSTSAAAATAEHGEEELLLPQTAPILAKQLSADSQEKLDIFLAINDVSPPTNDRVVELLSNLRIHVDSGVLPEDEQKRIKKDLLESNRSILSLQEELEVLVKLHQKTHSYFAEQEATPATVSFLCDICYEEHLLVDGFTTLDCGHRFCSAGLNQYICIKISEHAISQKEMCCPTVGCRKPIGLEIVEGSTVGTKFDTSEEREKCRQLFENYSRWLTENLISSGGAGEIIHCPNQKCTSLFIWGGPGPYFRDAQGRFYECEQGCKMQFCIGCTAMGGMGGASDASDEGESKRERPFGEAAASAASATAVAAVIGSGGGGGGGGLLEEREGYSIKPKAWPCHPG